MYYAYRIKHSTYRITCLNPCPMRFSSLNYSAFLSGLIKLLKISRYLLQLLPESPLLKRKNSTTAKWSVQERNFFPLGKVNNAPILKISIFPSCNCGDFTLFELWRCENSCVNLFSRHSMSLPRTSQFTIELVIVESLSLPA